MNTQDWSGCYDGSWQSAPLVAEAYAHPAGSVLTRTHHSIII